MSIAYLLVNFEIIRAHAGRGEALLELLAADCPIESADAVNSAHSVIHIIDNKAGFSFFDDFRHRPHTVCDDRGAARHRFNKREAKWFGPIDRKYKSVRIAEELGFFVIANFADIFH